MMNKKASSVLMMVFELLVVVLVSFTLTSAASAMGKSDLVMKVKVAEDLRQMVEIMGSVPGDALVKYPYNVSSFVFILSQGSIAVFEKGEVQSNWVVRDFFVPEEMIVSGILEQKSNLCLEKKNKFIQLRECHEF